ncbi:hypothetical protein QAD02_005744 [Eretmocerus hayati]|uniref:Uncharacterized protein n=1 Tax=Eretmocerus hayati TaxID=131215 RepID=A0ACC2NTN6_9HYME|nr:hypothetical protein QAD02_005744 [Eretmocerus hayati]
MCAQFIIKQISNIDVRLLIFSCIINFVGSIKCAGSGFSKRLEELEEPVEEGGINIIDQKTGRIVWCKLEGYNLWPCVIMDCQDLNCRPPKFAHQWVMLYGDYKTAQRTASFYQAMEIIANKVCIRQESESKKLLLVFLAKLRRDASQELQAAFSLDDYLIRLKACMSSLQIINSCRSGELERLCCSDYSRLCRSDTDDSSRTFDAILRDVTKNSFILTVSKKFAKTVKLVVPEGIKLYLDLLLQQRERAGINGENDYLFGLPENNGREKVYLETICTLREFAAEIEVPNPELLTATRLRKHQLNQSTSQQTQCVEIHLTDEDKDELARFMRHEADIHHPRIHRWADVRGSDDSKSGESKNSFPGDIVDELAGFMGHHSHIHHPRIYRQADVRENDDSESEESNNSCIPDLEDFPSEVDDLWYLNDFSASKDIPGTTGMY